MALIAALQHELALFGIEDHIGCSYIAALQESGFLDSSRSLALLTSSDASQIGVTKLAHRKALIQAVQVRPK